MMLSMTYIAGGGAASRTREGLTTKEGILHRYSDEECRLWIASYDAQSVLLNDSPTAKADVEAAPSIGGFNLVSLFVAGVEAIRARLIAAKTNPGVLVALLVFDELVGRHRVLTVPRLMAMSTPLHSASSASFTSSSDR